MNAICVQAALQALVREEQDCPVERYDDSDDEVEDEDEGDDSDA